MSKDCSQRTIRIAYPKHWPAPEDLLNFIESTAFTKDWAALGLDDEDDLVSLQLCVMANPEGDEIVAGTTSLRLHRHRFQRRSGVQAVTTYYAYFPDFGVVYLNCVDTGHERIKFSVADLQEINESITEFEAELERRKIIQVRAKRGTKHGRG
jgi:hypothetical protein